MQGLEGFTGQRKVDTEVVTGANKYADSPYVIPGIDEAKAEHAIAFPIAQVDENRKLVNEEKAWNELALKGFFVELVKSKTKGKNNSDKYYVVLQMSEERDGKTLPVEGKYLRIQAPGQLQKAVEKGLLQRGKFAELLYLGKLPSTEEGNETEYHSFMIRSEKQGTTTH